MATAVTDLERLLRVTVVHSPLVPSEEAKNLHRGSFFSISASSANGSRSTVRGGSEGSPKISQRANSLFSHLG
jgi:hypothetical protein